MQRKISTLTIINRSFLESKEFEIDKRSERSHRPAIEEEILKRSYNNDLKRSIWGELHNQNNDSMRHMLWGEIRAIHKNK